MNWVQEHLQLIIAAAAAIAYFFNSQRSAHDENDETQRPTEQASLEHAERTRRVQEEIRRKIAERRTGQSANRPEAERVPPMVRPSHVPPIDPFGGPMRRMARKLEEAASRLDEPIGDREAAARAEEIARQTKLTQKLRELEQVRAMQERRAAEILRGKKLPQPAVNAVVAVGSEVHQRLRDPREVRRGIVLREILGPPVALR